ncbi:hypothetical protein HAX54_048548 [Datura stramonium]|uniref:PUM-HD domain-containing protein n=1 Tax=Datura stramonium TaxID=4076 RepID=A0ABS8SVG8_DATST|nr:hypothetical protein [Datura stramonium]
MGERTLIFGISITKSRSGSRKIHLRRRKITPAAQLVGTALWSFILVAPETVDSTADLLDTAMNSLELKEIQPTMLSSGTAIVQPPEQFCSEDGRWRCFTKLQTAMVTVLVLSCRARHHIVHREPTGQFPILSVSNLVDYSYIDSLVPRNLNFRGHSLDNQELNRWNQYAQWWEMIDYVGDLMKNQSGSYVIQKLFVVCNEEQRTVIIQAITRNTHQFIGICFSPYGARAMQKLLDNLSTPQQRSLILSAITPVAVALANDQSGQHVIQFCVKTFSISTPGVKEKSTQENYHPEVLRSSSASMLLVDPYSNFVIRQRCKLQGRNLYIAQGFTSDGAKMLRDVAALLLCLHSLIRLMEFPVFSK